MEWNFIDNLNGRMLGSGNLKLFQNKASSSTSVVRRLNQTNSLDYHDGCVNCVNFNSTGDLIVSGSDDLQVAVWDWQKCDATPKISYVSGHNSNVFQTKFMPQTCDSTVVTCARDGQARVGFLMKSDTTQQTRRIAQHKGSVHKLSIESGSPNLLKTAGEDAVVYNIDLREPKPTKLLTLHNENNRRVALYSIHTNPMKLEEFAIGGRDRWSRIFDTRKVTQEKENSFVKKFCPNKLQEQNQKPTPNVTCLTYNHNGTELLVSYNDEDIYLFDTTHSSLSQYTHRYRGHRNSDTVKGVNFFGESSEYVVSGSDCSHIFIWNKMTEDIVTFLKGDSVGVVNVLEPHPHCCILATAGLDHDVKIWQPTGAPFREVDKLKKQMQTNEEAREEDLRNPAVYDNQLIFLMMRQLQQQRQRISRRRAQVGDNQDEDESASTTSNEDTDVQSFSSSNSNSSLADLGEEEGSSSTDSCIQS